MDAAATIGGVQLIRIHRHERGPRLYIAGCRIHHGSGFLVAAALNWRRPRLALACVAAAAHDWRDFPFRDCDNH